MKLRKLAVFIISLFTIASGAYGISYLSLPDEICVLDGSKFQASTNLPVKFTSNTLPDSTVSSNQSNKLKRYTTEAKFLGLLPLKKININVLPNAKYTPAGIAFGVKLYTDGVMVVGISEIETENGIKSPAYDAKIRTSDIIISVNGKKVLTNEELAQHVQSSQGKPIDIKFRRNNVIFNTKVTPVKDRTTGTYKIGMWVRDSTAGIGTMTFYSKQLGIFTGLGHGICDVDTGDIMPLMEGTVVKAYIKGIVKGVKERPGELKGMFMENKVIGSLLGNSESGIYGFLSDRADLPEGNELPIALKNEIVEGPAKILCTLEGEKVEQFDIRIVSVLRNSNQVSKNMIIEVTDKRLIEKTGGIVQGLSGSPIIQNGKLVGAVTHVLVNDPTRGFAIFDENMVLNILKTK